MTNRALAVIITGFLLLSPSAIGQENQDVSEADGEICYNMVTHTITAGASFAECMAYGYYVDADFNGMTFTGCYNMVSHVPDPTVNQTVCEALISNEGVQLQPSTCDSFRAFYTTVDNDAMLVGLGKPKPRPR